MCVLSFEKAKLQQDGNSKVVKTRADYRRTNLDYFFKCRMDVCALQVMGGRVFSASCVDVITSDTSRLRVQEAQRETTLRGVFSVNFNGRGDLSFMFVFPISFAG
jgi:hypothetical protein